ncbi:MAG: flagellar biosynthesis anti-sigma factor FlgM [Oscillospiraceae bacterium]|nr:flagellar biosynthesis anti-sigma factor FlgM [Oscillospiraceae bacterium]
MKISGLANIGFESYRNSGACRVDKSKPLLGADTLDISQSLFSDALAKAAMDSPIDRMDKISAIKRGIADGSYVADSAVIAERIIRSILG